MADNWLKFSFLAELEFGTPIMFLLVFLQDAKIF